MAGPVDTSADKPEITAKPESISFLSAREAVPTGETVTLTSAQKKARKRRSQWIALALFAFVILIFVVTITKLGANVLVRDL
jgi:t-SNARE complex subunit (syntaxin)